MKSSDGNRIRNADPGSRASDQGRRLCQDFSARWKADLDRAQKEDLVFLQILERLPGFQSDPFGCFGLDIPKMGELGLLVACGLASEQEELGGLVVGGGKSNVPQGIGGGGVGRDPIQSQGLRLILKQSQKVPGMDDPHSAEVVFQRGRGEQHEMAHEEQEQACQ